jgi:hypothetical protein
VATDTTEKPQNTQHAKIHIFGTTKLKKSERNHSHSVLFSVVLNTKHAGQAAIPASALLCPHTLRGKT